MTEALHVSPGVVTRLIQRCPFMEPWIQDQIRKGEVIVEEKGVKVNDP